MRRITMPARLMAETHVVGWRLLLAPALLAPP